MDQIEQKYSSWVGGLKVRSNRPIEEHPPAQGDGWDLDLVFVSDASALQGAGEDLEEGWQWLPVPLGETPVARVRSDGRMVWVEELPRSSTDYSLQARRVVPFSAALQGRILLHAGAVALKGEVHALVGESGVGKTTLVEEFRQCGFEVVAADLLPCKIEGNRVAARNPSTEEGQELSLSGIYFLERLDGLSEPQWEELPSVDVTQGLLRHGFGELELPRIWAMQFEAYARIAELCRGFRLVMPEGLEHLEKTARSLARDLLGSPTGHASLDP